MCNKQKMIHTVQIGRSSLSTNLLSMRDSITNEALTTDGIISYATINDLHDNIKYFGMSSHMYSHKFT